MSNNSETIWIDEIDRGLYKLLLDCVRVTKYRVKTPVNVEVAKADDDFKVNEFPTIQIYLDNYGVDSSREDSERLCFEFDENSSKGYTVKAPVPYRLIYKLKFYSLLQTQMNDMTRLFLDRVGHFYNLDVVNASGEKDTAFMSILPKISKGDLLIKNQRVFQTIFNVSVIATINERELEEVPTVTDIQVNLNE